MIIGRDAERISLLESAKSEYSEFVAVYGRRRVGKTFLVRETFGYSFAFHHTGMSKGGAKQQLDAFAKSLSQQGFTVRRRPRSWLDAFFLLENGLTALPPGKKVVFLDELPWMDTPKSDFVAALEHFWNGWASMRRDILLVVCGSATSWIATKLLKDKGGLHNRITRRIRLAPFTLAECERFAEAMGLALTRRQVLEYYMALGGIPFYWGFLGKGLSLDQNMDKLFFADGADLEDEFEQLYASLFKHPEGHVSVVSALAGKKLGLSRGELLDATGLRNNGGFTKVLADLCACGFARAYHPPGKKRRDAVYQLIDNFTLFHFAFLRGGGSSAGWAASGSGGVRNAWQGLAFERVCLEHLPQIKRALGISGVRTEAFSWRTTEGQGAQVDLVVDRADDIVNLCEMKFSYGEYEIDKEEHASLLRRRERFIATTKTHKAVYLTMVTTFGTVRNAYWNDIQSEVVMDDLFS